MSSASSYLLALDQGTTSSRAILFDLNFRLINIAQQNYTQHFPQPGWVEHNPKDIYQSQREVVSLCLKQAGISASQVIAAGITNQRETTIVWNGETGEPVYNAIVWQDRRTADNCLKLKAYAEKIQSKTGLLIDPYFSGTKIAWILDNIPGARKQAEAGKLRFGTVDTWLLWNLTHGAVHATDPSNASRTLLFNIHTLQWDNELCDLLGVPMSMLPEVRPTMSDFGNIREDIFGYGIPIKAMVGDQQAATFGNDCFKPGAMKCTYGTGCFIVLNTGTNVIESKNRLLSTIAWQNSDGSTYYALEGSILMGGATVQWLRDQLGIVSTSSEIEILTKSVANNGGLVFVPAFTGLGAPHWEPNAKGMILGLTRGTERGHIARAALESIALQCMDVMDCMIRDLGSSPEKLRVDGGASCNNMLMQFQADLLDIPVERPKMTECTALGAARMAAVSAGLYFDSQVIFPSGEGGTVFEPHMELSVRNKFKERWQKSIELCKAWTRE